MSAALEDEADPTYSHFSHRSEFLVLLDDFLAVDLDIQPTKVQSEREVGLVKSLGAILDYYLPLPGLLDPSLDAIIPPLLDKLAGAVSKLASGDGQVDQARLDRLGEVINWVVKVRGWKTTVQHFPSGIQFLSQLISLLSPPAGPGTSQTPLTPHHPLISASSSWHLRSVLLLWLALLLTVPFSLSAFSDTPASPSAYNLDAPAAARLLVPSLAPLAQRAVMLSLPLLHRPGKEGAYAALVLARVYSRPDAVEALPAFFTWAAAELEEGDNDDEANLVASLLELLALLPGMLPPGHLGVLKAFTEDSLVPHLRGSRTAAGSSLVRKLAIKARGRWWISRLTRSVKGKESARPGNEVDGLDAWLADGLEGQMDDLLSGLSDKDTIVRYSSAKYLARLAAALPDDFAAQLVDATIDLFGGTEDEPVLYTPAGTVLDPGGNAYASQGTMGFGAGAGGTEGRGEARWHGTCLAVAELARRGLIRGEAAVGSVIPWVLKALTFDIRRATHSIGSNVRDAAAYVLWSLSRACPAEAIRPFADDVATGLVAVACLDREVGVRRAASAAYQEGVGRLGLYPEGIDTLAKTDFYSVSVRRIAYTTAVPAVAVHDVYRHKLRDYLHGITLRHWDEAMRTAGAGALRDILRIGGDDEKDDAIRREIAQIPSLDTNNVHGALSALAAIAPSLDAQDPRRGQMFHALGTVRPAALISPQSACILISACDLICGTLNEAVMSAAPAVGRSVIDGNSTGGAADSSEKVQKILNHIIETTMRRREEGCHEAVKDVRGCVSALKGEREVGDMVTKLITDLKSFRATQRQSAALCLGSIRYDRSPPAADVETRRYAIRSLASIAVQPVRLPLEKHRQIISAFITALSDYSTDQRGDVGSWIRVAALNALRTTLSNACLPATNEAAQNGQADKAGSDASHAVGGVISQGMFDDIIANMARLGVEKLEPVRAAAAFAWTGLRQAGAARVWEWEGVQAFGAAIGRGDVGMTEDNYEELFRHTGQQAWFASAMPLLRTKYRASVVQGLALTIGSQVESVAMLAFTPLLATITSEAAAGARGPDNAPTGDLGQQVLADLTEYMARELGSNRVFVPCLQTAWRLAVAFKDVGGSQEGATDAIWARIVGLACRGLPTIKSIERLSGSVKLLMALLTADLPQTQRLILRHLPSVLSHRFPRIRSMCAEQLYLALSEAASEADEEMGVELEEALLEVEWTGDEAIERAEGVVGLVAVQLGVQVQ